ncbi:MAG: response regulator [Spirochaetaceae bacterium]|nr:response regulator [Spirochaetaceae bacterium]MCF7947764.1 response regulator [Spirochaetia bacterium]MCF7950627.1 response regulator [Spirochaetaceae bacterium]
MKSLSIDALPYPAAVIDTSYSILSLNRRCVKLIGGENESYFLGHPLQNLLCAHPQGDLEQILENYLDGRLFRAAVMHSEGYTIVVNGRVQPEPESEGFLLIFDPEIKPAPEPKQNEKGTAESIECILSLVLLHSPHYTQAYKELLEKVTTYFDFSGGALYLKSTTEAQLDFKYSHGLSEPFRHFLSTQSSREWSGIHRPLLFERKSRKNPISPILQQQGVQAMLLLPINDDNSLDGLVVLFAFLPKDKYGTHLSETETVANYLGMLFSRLSHEEKQDSSEKLFRSLVRSMPSGLIVRDETEKVILYNLAAARLLGMRNDTSIDPKLLMQGLQILNKKGDVLAREKLPSIVSLKEGRKIRNYELKIIREDGTYRWVSINSEPLFRTGEISPYASVATFKDITENRKILREFENAKQAAESANQSKSRFLANVSHEIRTPLSGIMGMTDILLGADLKQEQREQLLLMKEAEASLLDIINKVLELSKIESGNIIVENNTFQLRSTVKKSVMPLFMGKQDSELTMDISVADDVPNILIGDAQRLQQVLANLVSNAIKFTHSGTITVSVTLEQLVRESATLRFVVKDSGIGISEEEIERIFDSFQQVDSGFSKKQQGFGLGLSITKQIIEIMGGRIWVESTPGEGSSFFFTVSFLLGRGTAQAISSQKSTIPSPSYSLTILLAEDNELNQKSIAYFLSKMGHEVEIAENGSEALKLLSQKRFDLVLMDVQMPEMNGLDATRAIRGSDGSQFDSQIPIIALTAYAMKEDVHHILSCGMNAYVSKPLSRDILAEAIGRVFLYEHQNKRKSEPLGEGSTGLGQLHKFDTIEASSQKPASLTDFSTFIQDYQGDIDIAQQLLELFYRDVPGKMSGIEEALSKGYLQETVDAFHSLTNNLSAVRLYSLGNISRFLEREALRGNIEEVEEQFPAFQEELKKAVQQAQHYLAVIEGMREE